MKKIFTVLTLVLLGSFVSFAQDSAKTAKKIHHAKHVVKAKKETAGQKLDTATKKTGRFTKKVANNVASSVSTSKDKSLKGPHGEAVYNGKRGGKYYVSKKTGKKVYFKSDKTTVDTLKKK